MSIRLTMIMIACVAAACGDDGKTTCGPGSASADGLTLAGGSASVMYGGLSAGSNNDCGVGSLTVFGTQVGGTDLLTFCIPTPAQLGDGAQTLGLDHTAAEIQLVDLEADTATCAYSLDATTPPTGTVTATGVCSDGTNAAGFALTFAGTVSMTQTCGATMTTVSATLTGSVAVAAAAN